MVLGSISMVVSCAGVTDAIPGVKGAWIVIISWLAWESPLSASIANCSSVPAERQPARPQDVTPMVQLRKLRHLKVKDYGAKFVLGAAVSISAGLTVKVAGARFRGCSWRSRPSSPPA